MVLASAPCASSNACAKLTPSIGDCVTPRICAGGSMPERVEHGRHHVDGVRVLRADLALGLDALRPVDDERIADAAAVGLALPAAERRVAGEGPAPRVVVEVLRPAELVDRREVLLQRSSGTLLKNLFSLTEPCGPPSALAPLSEMTMISVLSNSPMSFEEVEQPADVVVGVLEEAGEHLHHAGVELLLVGRAACPSPARRDRGATARRPSG